MHSGNAENIGAINSKLLSQKNTIDRNLDGFLLDPNHPKYPETLRIRTQAQSAFDQAQLSLGMQDGWEGVRQAYNKLGELYQRSMEIRASMLPSSIGAAIGEPLETLERRMEQYKEIPHVKQIVEKFLVPIARGLAVDPTAVLASGNAPNNRYYFKVGSELRADLKQADEDRDQMAEIRQKGMLQAFPELEGIMKQLENGMSQLRTFNPILTQKHTDFVSNENQMHKTDYRPLRIVVALAGGLISGLGLTYNLFTGNPVTWPTMAWAAIAGYSLYPNMLQGADKNAMESIARLNTPTLHKLMQSGFSGEKGMQAFTELQSLGSGKRKIFQQLAASKEPVQAAQLGALTDGKNTALLSMLRTIPNTLTQTFETMGKPLSKNDQGFMAAMIKNLPLS